MINKVLFSKKSDEWETPKELFDELDREFEFDLDVCATRENKKCSNWYGKELDGLKQGWCNHHVFCNPPYSQISKWVEKAYKEWNKDCFTKIVMLLPVRTDTKWFHRYIYDQDLIDAGFIKIRFIKGRLKFSNSKNSAPFPSMIVIFN